MSVYIHDDAYLAIVVLLNSTPYRGQRTEYTSMRENKLWMSRNEVVLHVCMYICRARAGLGWDGGSLFPFMYFCLSSVQLGLEVEGFLCSVLYTILRRVIA